jgi:hypothetical protein
MAEVRRVEAASEKGDAHGDMVADGWQGDSFLSPERQNYRAAKVGARICQCRRNGCGAGCVMGVGIVLV